MRSRLFPPLRPSAIRSGVFFFVRLNAHIFPLPLPTSPTPIPVLSALLPSRLPPRRSAFPKQTPHSCSHPSFHTHLRTIEHPSQNFLMLERTFMPRTWPITRRAWGAPAWRARGAKRAARDGTASMGRTMACVEHCRDGPARRRTKENMAWLEVVRGVSKSG